jgi:hypothetical protein
MPTFRQAFLPYAFMRMHDGWLLPMNREYKRLGSWSAWNDADTDKLKIRIKGLTALNAERIGLIVSEHYYHLYDDATNPESSAANWARYQGIMAKLMKLDVEYDDGRRPAAMKWPRRRYQEYLAI